MNHWLTIFHPPTPKRFKNARRVKLLKDSSYPRQKEYRKRNREQINARRRERYRSNADYRIKQLRRTWRNRGKGESHD